MCFSIRFWICHLSLLCYCSVWMLQIRYWNQLCQWFTTYKITMPWRENCTIIWPCSCYIEADLIVVTSCMSILCMLKGITGYTVSSAMSWLQPRSSWSKIPPHVLFRTTPSRPLLGNETCLPHPHQKAASTVNTLIRGSYNWQPSLRIYILQDISIDIGIT